MTRAFGPILAVLILVAPAAAQVPPPLIAAVTALEQVTTPALEATYAYGAHATNTHAAWVLVRNVAALRSQSKTLVTLVAGPNPHLDVARNTVHHMVVTAHRVDQLLSAPIGAGEPETTAMHVAWARVRMELGRVVYFMPPPR